MTIRSSACALLVLAGLGWTLVGAEPPVAPAPRLKPETTAGKPKKPWSELIVGKWKFFKAENPPAPPTLSALTEFTADGKVMTNVSDPVRGFKLVRTGTYKLEGAILRVEYAPSKEEEGEASEAKIESLTEDELIISNGVDGVGRQMRTIFKRDMKK